MEDWKEGGWKRGWKTVANTLPRISNGYSYGRFWVCDWVLRGVSSLGLSRVRERESAGVVAPCRPPRAVLIHALSAVDALALFVELDQRGARPFIGD